MLDSGFMPLVSKGSDRNLFGCRCVVATREKTTVSCSWNMWTITLHTLLKTIICCLQLNTGGGSDDNLKVDF